jgi:hypothetical protein
VPAEWHVAILFYSFTGFYGHSRRSGVLVSGAWLLVDRSSLGSCRSIGVCRLESLRYFLGLPPEPNGVQGLGGAAAIYGLVWLFDTPL